MQLVSTSLQTILVCVQLVIPETIVSLVSLVLLVLLLHQQSNQSVSCQKGLNIFFNSVHYPYTSYYWRCCRVNIYHCNIYSYHCIGYVVCQTKAESSQNQRYVFINCHLFSI